MINQHTAENRSILKDILVGAGFDDKKVKRAIGYPVPIGFALNSQQPSGGGGGDVPAITPEEWRESLIIDPEEAFVGGSGFDVSVSVFPPDNLKYFRVAFSASKIKQINFDRVVRTLIDGRPNGAFLFFDADPDGIFIPAGYYEPVPYVVDVPENVGSAYIYIEEVIAGNREVFFTVVPRMIPGDAGGKFTIKIDGEPIPTLKKTTDGAMLLSYNETDNLLDPNKKLFIGSTVEVLSTVPWSMEFIYDTNQRFTKKGGATLEDADDPQPNGKFRLPVPPPWPQLDDGLEVDKTSS